MPQMSAAPFPLMLEGRTFYMSPLTDRDIDELTNWLQAEIINTARNVIRQTPDMDADERQELLGAACAYAATLTYGEPKSKPYVGTLKGVARMLYQGIRKAPVPFDEFRKLIKSKESIDAAMSIWTKLNVMQKHQDAGGDSQPAGGDAAEQGGDLRDAGGAVQVHAEANQPHDAVSLV